MYLAFKHSHMLLAILSITFFCFRFYLQLKSSPLNQTKFIKIAPHVIDTLLLLSAVALMITINQYPFVQAWITEKLFAVILYILSGLLTLKLAKTTLTKWLGFGLAWFWIMLIGHLAFSKQAILLAF